jgi:TonB family protein
MWVGLGLTVALGSACAINPPPGRPGIDFDIPAESPPFLETLTAEGQAPEAAQPGSFDEPPKLIKQTQPKYPRWAFDQRIQGIVNLQIVIDGSGRVAAWKIVRSIPSLDAAAVACVRQWSFSPARAKGRPVATMASAPVSFRIY